MLIGSETAKQQLGRQSHSQTDDTHTNYDDEQAAIDNHAVTTKVVLAQVGHAEPDTGAS